MSLASTRFDLVLGVDVHFEWVPMPAPVPVPLPHPFVGMVFDPGAMLGELMFDSVTDLVMGGPAEPAAGKVLINGMTATVTGEFVTNSMTLPHFIMPPGTGWAPVPRAPTPKIGLRGKVGKMPSPVVPPGDALLLQGSMTVQMMGANAVRMGDMALSCSDPVRLPTASVLSIPKGRPVLIGGPPAVNWGEAKQMLKGRLMRNRWVASRLHKIVARWSPDRLRNFFHKSVCFLTGHPVDVATGRVLTTMPGFSLPAPIPFKWEPEYASSWAHRRGALGHGWSHPFEQAVWAEIGSVVYQTEDGREIEFSTLDLPEEERALSNGRELYEPVNRLSLRRVMARGDDVEHWEVATHEGIVHRFARIPGDPDTRRANLARIISTTTRDGQKRRFEYEAGRLARIFDGAGRRVDLQYDTEGNLDRVYVPHPTKPDEVMLAARYVYSKAGDLVEALDAIGNATKYEYGGLHLLVRETNRNGLSFYFVYDDVDSLAKCVRTWGDGGIYDHEIDYLPRERVTIVSDSTGATTAYFMNPLRAVVKIVDPFGYETCFAYDDELRKISERDAEGRETRWEYDERGNETAEIDPLGNGARTWYDEHNSPIRFVNEVGAEWSWQYDELGRRTREVDPQGHLTSFRYEERTGLLSAIDEPGTDRLTELAYDEHKNNSVLRVNGAVWRRRYDRLGRYVEEMNPKGHVQTITRDLAGRMVRLEDEDNVHILAHDPEGNIIRDGDKVQTAVFEYTGFNWLASRQEVGAELVEMRFEHDKEGRLTVVQNEVGERWRYVRDVRGDVVEEVGFDGLRRRYKRDKVGNIVEVRSPSGAVTKLERDACDRIVKIVRPEGEDIFKWRPDGALVEATNPTMRVQYERDILGRVTLECQGEDHWVTSYFHKGGVERYAMKSGYGARYETIVDPNGDLRELAIGDRDERRLRIGFSRDELGLEIERRLPGGVTFTTERDATGRPLLQRSTRDSEDLTRRSYAWQFEDRLTEIADSTFGTARFEHDRRGRLASADFDGGRQHRVPDLAGNIYRDPARKDRRFVFGGQLYELCGKPVQHDGDGNLSRKPTPNGDIRFSYYSTGLLKEAVLPDGRKVTYAYDALGRRVSKTVGDDETRWLWDGDNILHEVGPGGFEAGVETWLWEPGTFNPIARLTKHSRELVLPDHLGTPAAAFDEAGRLAWQMQLDLYGVPRQAPGSASDVARLPRWRWPGQVADEETGLYYNRFRYYDPELGRYLSQDPLGLAGGLELFGYVSDPLAVTDPLALSGCHSVKTRLKRAQLPTTGRIRFVPQRGYHASSPLPRGPKGGYVDRFANEWVKGPTRTAGQAFEWDVQLSALGRAKLGWLSPDQAHVNVSLDGRVTH